MAIIEALYEYPLAGCQAHPLQETYADETTFQRDRDYMLYDSEKMGPNEAHPRLGQKQAPMLARVTVQFGDEGHPYFQVDGTELDNNLVPDPWGPRELYVPPTPVRVDEFGDIIIAGDVGNKAADFFADFTGIKGARLARRDSNATHYKDHPNYIPPTLRRSAVVHVASLTSYDALGLGPDITGGILRFRPNVVIDGLEPFKELELRDMRTSGGAILHLVRPTIRCAVPGYDPTTGENLKDVPKIYPQLRQIAAEKGFSGTEPIFGVYGWFEQDKTDPDSYGSIEVGQEIEIIN